MSCNTQMTDRLSDYLALKSYRSILLYDTSLETTVTIPTLGAVRFHCLRATDADLLYAFFQTLGKETRAWFRPHTPWTYEVAQDLAAKTEDPDFIRFLVLAERDGQEEPAGYGFFENLQSARPVLGIAVADAYQEQGLGQAIMQHLKRVARQLGKKRIILTVDGDNARAQHVYAKMGFTLTRLIPGSSHNAREMECVL